MSEPVRRLLDEYRARFAAGERPDVGDYVARAGDGGDALAELLDDFLRTAPAPDPPPETVAAIRAIAAVEPALLAQRTARGVRRETVIDALMTRFGFKTTSRAKLEERYHELESGLLDAGRVDTGVLDAIATALGLVRSQLVFSRPPQALLQAYLRMPPGARPRPGASMAPHLLAAPMAGPAAAPEEPDEIDRLFGVGP
jgi:hypothetical protein